MPVFVGILKHYGSPEEQVLPSAGSRGSGINLCRLPRLTLPSAGPYDPNKLEKIFHYSRLHLNFPQCVFY